MKAFTLILPRWLQKFFSEETTEYVPIYDRLKERLGYGMGLELVRPLDNKQVTVNKHPQHSDLVYASLPNVFSGDIPVEWILPCPVCHAQPGYACDRNIIHAERALK